MVTYTTGVVWVHYRWQMSPEYQVTLKQRQLQLACLFISLFSLTIKTTSMISFIGPFVKENPSEAAGGCFTNVSRALWNNLAEIDNATNHIYGEDFKLNLCTCAQSIALVTRTKFQLEILIKSTISAIHKFWENVLERERNVTETHPWISFSRGQFKESVSMSWPQHV